MSLLVLLELTLLVKFLGFSISWIGGLVRLLIGGVVLFRKVFLSWLKFSAVLLFRFLFVRFAWDFELLIILGLIGFFSWLGIIFWLSGLLRGFFNNGFLLELSLRDFPFTGEIRVDLSSFFCL